jgi:hypothetical protein
MVKKDRTAPKPRRTRTEQARDELYRRSFARVVIQYRKRRGAKYGVPAARVTALVADRLLTGDEAILVDAIRQWIPTGQAQSWKLHDWVGWLQRRIVFYEMKRQREEQASEGRMRSVPRALIVAYRRLLFPDGLKVSVPALDGDGRFRQVDLNDYVDGGTYG